MPQPASAELEVVAAGARYRCEYARPVRVELAVGVSQHMPAIDDNRRVTIVVVLPRAGRSSGPAGVVLAAIHFDEYVRRDLAVEPANPLHERLRHPRDPCVANPQPHEGLPVRVIQGTDERTPASDASGGAREHRIHALL